MHRLRCRNRGARVAHGGHRNEAAFQNDRRLNAEKCRLPDHQVGELADFNRADLVRNAVGNRRVDGVFGDVAFDAEIVVAFGVARQLAALLLHLVGVLPGADDDFADAAHGLAVAGHHADGAQVVQDVLGGDGFLADAAFGKGQVFGNRRVQVVADHQHVNMLVERVDGVGHGRVGR